MIKDITKELIGLSDVEWGKYAFSRDPLNRKVLKEQRIVMIKEAISCGRKKAVELKQQYGECSIQEYAERLKVKIHYEDSYGSENYIVFARFNFPDKVTIYNGNVDKVNQLIRDNDMYELLEYVNIGDVLLAHEMFHLLEEKDHLIYNKTEKIELWKIGPFHNKSGLVAIGEIAAMSFARELVGITYNPYVFDAIMLYPHDKEKSKKLIDEILRIKETHEYSLRKE